MNGFVIRTICCWMIVLVFSAGSVYGDLAGRINAVINQKDNAKATFTVKVIKADTGAEVYARNADKLMMPASNMKIVTTAAALAYLGGDYEFTTRVGLCGGDVAVIGGGDPLLGDKDTDSRYGRTEGWVFEEIVAGLRGKGVTDVNDVVVDGSFFDGVRVHPNWPSEQLNQPYACEVCGLNFNENCVLIKVQRGYSGAVVIVEPATNYLTFIDKVQLVGSGNSAIGAYRNRTPNLLTLKGRLRKEAGFRLAIENPAMMFGTILKERLVQAGIDIRGEVVEKDARSDERFELIWRHQTPINDVLIRCNKDSLNLGAESLVKTISAECSAGKCNGSWEHGFELIGKYLEILGIDKSEFVLDDGCGLSRGNKVSANVLAGVLKNIYDSSKWSEYKDTLAVGGEDGTTYKYFREEKYKGKVIGKTGYISGVRTFSGVCQTDSGEFIFSILTSGGSSKVRAGINDIVKAVMDEY